MRCLYNHVKQIEYYMKVKTITIRDDQEVWLKDSDRNLSRMTQRKIDEEMHKDGAL